MDFNNKKIEELNNIKEWISNKYIIDYSMIDIIKNKLSFIASFISTDTNRAFVELNQLCDNMKSLLKNNDKSSNVFILDDLLELYSSEYDNLKIIIHVLNLKVKLIIIENENNILIKLDFPF